MHWCRQKFYLVLSVRKVVVWLVVTVGRNQRTYSSHTRLVAQAALMLPGSICDLSCEASSVSWYTWLDASVTQMSCCTLAAHIVNQLNLYLCKLCCFIQRYLQIRTVFFDSVETFFIRSTSRFVFITVSVRNDVRISLLFDAADVTKVHYSALCDF